MDHGIASSLVTPARTLTFNSFTGDYLRLRDFHLGRPVRLSVENAPQTDGAILGTSRRGGLYPILRGQIVAATPAGRRVLEDDIEEALESIRDADGTLKFTPYGQAERQATVRLFEDAPIASSQGVRGREFQIMLVSSDPLIYSSTLQTATTSALIASPGGAFDLDSWSFPFSFGDYSSGGLVTVTNGGRAETFPTIKIYGQIAGPAIRNVTTGKRLSLAGLTLAAGDYVEIDMRRRTIRLNGSAELSQLSKIDRANSAFWGLPKGANQLQLTGSNFNGTARAEIFWRDAWA